MPRVTIHGAGRHTRRRGWQGEAAEDSLSVTSLGSSAKRFVSHECCCREARKKERLEGEVKQLKTALEARQADIKTKSAAAQQSEEQVSPCTTFNLPQLCTTLHPVSAFGI